MESMFTHAELTELAEGDALVTGARFDMVLGTDWRRISKTRPDGMGSQIDVGYADGKTVLLVRLEDRSILQAYVLERVAGEPEIRSWYSQWVKDNLDIEPLD